MIIAQASVVSEYEHPPEVSEIVLRDLKDNGMVARVAACTLCGTDLHIWKGQMATGSGLPYIPGHEMVGVVERIGRAGRLDIMGDPVEEGERIVWAYPWCGKCYWCAIANEPTLCRSVRRYGRESIDRFPYLLGGCSSHFYVLPEAAVLKVPEGLPDDLVASSTCALRTVMHAFERAGRISSDETVLVQGLGPVGLFSVAAAIALGARLVIAIDSVAPRLEMARTWGVQILNLSSTSVSDRHETILAATGGRGVDIAFEASGAASAFAEGISNLRAGGRYVVIGPVTRARTEITPSRVSQGQLTIVGVRSGSIRHYNQAISFLKRYENYFDFSSMLGSHHGLESVGRMLQRMERGLEIKPVIVP